MFFTWFTFLPLLCFSSGQFSPEAVAGGTEVVLCYLYGDDLKFFERPLDVLRAALAIAQVGSGWILVLSLLIMKHHLINHING